MNDDKIVILCGLALLSAGFALGHYFYDWKILLVALLYFIVGVNVGIVIRNKINRGKNV